VTGRSRGRYRPPAGSDREDLPPEETLHELSEGNDSDPPLLFDPDFAAWAAIVIAVVAGIVLAPVAYRLYDTDAADPVDRMAISTSLALLIVGVLVLLSGVYLALLEVRGRLRLRPRGEREAGNSSIRGALRQSRSLVIVVLLAGCVPLIAAAWVAQSGVDSQSGPSATQSARTRTPSPVPSGTTTTPTP
jgi:4-amino-4-deoxy-L-arabinose transferase-like glycosyltransferase